MKNLIFNFSLFICLSLSSNELILSPKNILDVNNGEIYTADILIKDGVIKKIGKNLSSNTNIEVINLRNMTLIPGLMDAHVHLIGNNEHGRPLIQELMSYFLN